MLTLLKDWKGPVEVNGVEYNTISAVKTPVEGPVHIILHTKAQNTNKQGETQVVDGVNKEIRITVKKYMTEKSSPGFDFMAKWNNDNPMPLRTMTGKVIQETRGMVKMELHGDIWAEKICTCMACGKRLTNPVSQYFGIGPECGGHNYVHPFNTDEELKEAVAEYRKKLQETKWTGWIIKSAIVQQEEVS